MTCECKQEKRIEKMERDTEFLFSKINPLEVNLAKLTTTVDYLKEKIDRIEKLVEQLSELPAQRWNDVTRKIISGIVGAAITLIGSGIFYAISAMGSKR